MKLMFERKESSESKPLHVACIGGGPGGLFYGIALAQAMPAATVDIFEQNKESDVFGFGVVFSDATLDNIDRVDSVLRDVLASEGRHWDKIEVRAKGAALAAGGNGMSAVHRRVLLGALRDRARALGVRLQYSTRVNVDDLDADGAYDLIIAADGTNSNTRQQFLEGLGHSVNQAEIKFIWFGTTYQFDGLTFLHEQSEHGNFAVHAYPIGSELSTFIVETDEATWRRAGLDGFDMSAPPGASDTFTQHYLEKLFASQIDGHPLVANNSRWSNFLTRRTRHWLARTNRGTPIAFIGDAIHTAHFSVGSGTKMAMEDAAVLAHAVSQKPDDLGDALAEFEAEQSPSVDKIQNSSVPSLSWWDHFGEYYRAFEPWQLGFHFFSRAISAGKMRVRDPAFVTETQRAWMERHQHEPLATPLKLGSVDFQLRLLSVAASSDNALQLSDGVSSISATQMSAEFPLIIAPDVDCIWLESSICHELDELCVRQPAAIVVCGGKAHARVLCSEYIRLQRGVPAIIVDTLESVRSRRAMDERDCAATLVLSGRADAVAFTSNAVVRQLGGETCGTSA